MAVPNLCQAALMGSAGTWCLFMCEKLTCGYCPGWETPSCSKVLFGTRAGDTHTHLWYLCPMSGFIPKL